MGEGWRAGGVGEGELGGRRGSGHPRQLPWEVGPWGSVSGRGVPRAGPADAPAWKFYRAHSFLDYIMGGCQIHFTVRARTPLPTRRQQSLGALPVRRTAAHVPMWVD